MPSINALSVPDARLCIGKYCVQKKKLLQK